MDEPLGGEGKWLCLWQTKLAAALPVSGGLEAEPRSGGTFSLDWVLKTVREPWRALSR